MEKSNSKRSLVWNYFNKKDKFIAVCTACGKELSYKASVSNLAKHWQRKHGEIKQRKDCSDACGDSSDDDDDDNDDKKDFEEKDSTWKHFDVLDSDKFLVRCKVCQKEITYDFISDLTEHLKEHGDIASDEEKEELSIKETAYWGKNSRRTSVLWRFFDPVDDATAICTLCGNKLSFATSITNLRRHLMRAHPKVDLGTPVLNNKKKVIISTNGQLYEIQTTDDEKDPIQTDEIYLEDSLEDNYVEDVVTETAETPSPPLVKKHKRPEKRTLEKNLRYSINKSNSSDEDIPVNKAPKTNTLDFFGQYIIALLKDMPKHVSDQLQGEIIKQIITAKTALNTPYSVTLSNKPVTVTMNNVPCKSIPEITVNDIGDVKISKENSNSELTNDK